MQKLLPRRMRSVFLFSLREAVWEVLIVTRKALEWEKNWWWDTFSQFGMSITSILLCWRAQTKAKGQLLQRHVGILFKGMIRNLLLGRSVRCCRNWRGRSKRISRRIVTSTFLLWYASSDWRAIQRYSWVSNQSYIQRKFNNSHLSSEMPLLLRNTMHYHSHIHTSSTQRNTLSDIISTLTSFQQFSQPINYTGNGKLM